MKEFVIQLLYCELEMATKWSKMEHDQLELMTNKISITVMGIESNIVPTEESPID